MWRSSYWTKSIRFHQSWCTISVFGHVQEISVNTDWTFVFSSFFCFYCFGFFLLSLSDLWIFSIPATAANRSPPDCIWSINPKVKNQHGIYEQNCFAPPPHFCSILAAMLKQILKNVMGKCLSRAWIHAGFISSNNKISKSEVESLRWLCCYFFWPELV